MLSGLPDSSRLWIFAADRPLSTIEQQELLDEVHAFLAEWRSHGRPVQAGADTLEDRLLLVGAHIDERRNAGVSGCGIDAMTAAVDAAAERLGFAWLDGLHVLYRSPEGPIEALPRSAFRQEARAGRMTAETPVIDTTITQLASLRGDGLERPARESWHSRVFRLREPASAAG